MRWSELILHSSYTGTVCADLTQDCLDLRPTVQLEGLRCDMCGADERRISDGWRRGRRAAPYSWCVLARLTPSSVGTHSQWKPAGFELSSRWEQVSSLHGHSFVMTPQNEHKNLTITSRHYPQTWCSHKAKTQFAAESHPFQFKGGSFLIKRGLQHCFTETFVKNVPTFQTSAMHHGKKDSKLERAGRP